MCHIFSSVHISWYQKRDHAQYPDSCIPWGDHSILNPESTILFKLKLGILTRCLQSPSGHLHWLHFQISLIVQFLASISHQMHLGLGENSIPNPGGTMFSSFTIFPCSSCSVNSACNVYSARSPQQHSIRHLRSESSRLIVQFSIPSWPWIPTMFLYVWVYWIQSTEGIDSMILASESIRQNSSTHSIPNLGGTMFFSSYHQSCIISSLFHQTLALGIQICGGSLNPKSRGHNVFVWLLEIVLNPREVAASSTNSCFRVHNNILSDKTWAESIEMFRLYSIRHLHLEFRSAGITQSQILGALAC